MILYYTDIQVDRYSRFDHKTSSGYGLRLDNIIECSEWISKEIRERKPKVVINGGDTYNSIGIVNSETLSATGKVISNINNACKEVGAEHIMILGNHDLSLVSNKVTTVDHLSELSNLTLVKEPSEFEVNNHRFGLIPYNHDTNYTREALLNSMNKGHKIAFTHLDFNGMRFNSKMRSTSELETDIYSKKFKIINGHYHIYQELGNVLCPGSCIQHKYSEFSEKRGILYIDSQFNNEFIQNPVSPLLIKVNSLEELKNLNLPESSYVYIDFNPLVDNEDEVLEELNKYSRTIINRSSSSISIKKIENSLKGNTNEELMEDYITNYFNTELSKDRLKELALTFIK